MAGAGRATAGLLALILSACADRDGDTARPPTPARWDGRHRDAPAWTAALLAALRAEGRPLLAASPADMPLFCPRYPDLGAEERAAVWLMLFSAVAEQESGFRPDHAHREAFTDASGHPVISRGLLQTSFESTRHYGCDHATPTDTHDPARNLACGVRIMTHHVTREGRIGGTTDAPGTGAARYWAVLRPGHATQTLGRIAARTATHPLCRPAPSERRRLEGRAP